MTDASNKRGAARRFRQDAAALVQRHPELTTQEAQERLQTTIFEDDMADVRLTEALYIRVAPGDIARLDELAARIPIASRNAIARQAMRIGMTAIDRDPAVVLAVPKRGRRT